MEKNGLAISPGYVVNSDFEFQGGYNAMTALLALHTPPQAVFASNDAMAIGVYHALFQAGMRILQDMAVMGYDDIELARYLTPPLSTIHQPKDELGQLAIDTLIYRLGDPDGSQQTLELTQVLVVCAST
nr:transcriptional regulator RbsR [Candidatus Pantoea persica]